MTFTTPRVKPLNGAASGLLYRSQPHTFLQQPDSMCQNMASNCHFIFARTLSADSGEAHDFGALVESVPVDRVPVRCELARPVPPAKGGLADAQDLCGLGDREQSLRLLVLGGTNHESERNQP